MNQQQLDAIREKYQQDGGSDPQILYWLSTPDNFDRFMYHMDQMIKEFKEFSEELVTAGIEAANAVIKWARQMGLLPAYEPLPKRKHNGRLYKRNRGAQ